MKNNLIRIVKMMAFYSFLGLVLQGVLVTILLASPAEGQNLRDIKVSVKAIDVTLEQALQIIEQKTNFKFFYVKEDIPLNEKATVIVDEESLYNILEVFAKDYGLTFNRINDQIVVKKNQGQTENLVTAVETGTVRGKVTDGSTKEPLYGASVVLKGTTKGANTDVTGKFEIDDVKPGKYTVVVSYVGYSAATKTITVSANQTVDVNFDLGQSAINLDEVTVTGSLSERSVRESATPIRIIEPKELENRNLTIISDVIASVPSFHMSGLGASNYTYGDTRAGSYALGYLNTRGFQNNLSGASSSSGTKFIIDGVEQFDHKTVLNLDPEQIAKIEIAAGPMATTLYGAGASNGIVQIFTKRGFGTPKLSFKTTYITKDEKWQLNSPTIQDYSLGLNGGVENFGYRLGLHYYYSPTDRYSIGLNIPEKDFSFSAGLNGKISDFDADLFVQFSRNKYSSSLAIQSYYNYGLENGFPIAKAVDSKWQADEKVTTVNLNLKHKLTDNIYQKLSLGLSTTDHARDELNYFTKVLSKQTGYNLKYFLNYKEALSDDFKLEVTAGGESVNFENMYSLASMNVAYGDNISQQVQAASSTTFYNNTAGTLGLFGEAVLGYNDDLFLTLGYRTENNTSYGANIGWVSIPRVGLTYVTKLGDFTFKPRFAAGSSTQPFNPTLALYQKTVYSFGTYIYLENKDLKPQEESGYEFGGDIFFTDRISLGITYYDQVLKNMISAPQLSVDNTNPSVPIYTYQYQNIAKVYKKGVELTARAVYEPFTVAFSMSSISSTYGEGAPVTPATGYQSYYYQGAQVIGVPISSYFAQVSYHIPALFDWSKRGGDITLEYKWTHGILEYSQLDYYKAYYATPRTTVYNYVYSKPISVVNLRFNYGVTNNVSLFADIQNLLNYQEYIYVIFPNHGRNMAFGFKLDI